MSLEKQLADTDSIYCTKTTSSNQTSIFLGNFGDTELDVLFGPDYKSNDEVRLRLDKSNLAFNAVSHVLDGKNWFKRKSGEKWAINSEWLNARMVTLEDVFSENHNVFIASLNKDENSTHRLYLKGMTSLSRGDGKKTLALRDFLFSGDVIVLTKLDNGDLGFEVKIPDDPSISLHCPAISIVPLLATKPEKDRLSDAVLQLFAEKRSVLLAVGEKNYDECCAEVRAEAARIDGDYLVTCDYDAFRNTLNARQVANSFFSKHTDDDKRRLGDFIAAVRQEPRDISFYLAPGNQPNVSGVGPAMLTAFLTRTRPDLFVFFTEQMFESVKFLGLTAEDALPALSTDAYNTYKGIQTAIRDRMREMGIKAENGNDADYLTVNEFTWFVSENKDLITEEAMSKKLKDVVPTMYDEGNRKPLAFNPNSKEDELLLRLLAALRAKPFAILAGHSGTGKSRYAKKLAYMTCNAVELRKEGRLPGNYLLLQVRPNWHDSTELLGFRNAMDGNRYQKTKLIEFLFRAYQFKETPFFLCLDEMNLAPVEQYFAEFLSSMESAEPVPLNDLSAEDDNLFELGCEWKAAYEHLAANGFSIPRNLFVVGTVNMDETTNQFSRKVLDRAFTIEMTDVDFRNYGHVAPPGYGDTIGEEMIQALLHGEKFVESLDPEDVAEGAPLVRVQKALEPTAFAIAYRFANEYTLLKRAIACFDPSGAMKLDALDQAVLMKILPRVAGERDYIEQVYGRNENEGLRKALEGKAVSLGKIAEIMKRARDMNAQYITFWP